MWCHGTVPENVRETVNNIYESLDDVMSIDTDMKRYLGIYDGSIFGDSKWIT